MAEERGGSDGDEADSRPRHRWRFRLPPVRLPPVSLPPFVGERRLPVGGVGVLVVAALVDIGDAWVALSAGGPGRLLGSIAVLVIATLLAGRVGLLAGWEVIAVLLGAGRLTVIPSVVGVVLVRARWHGRG